MGPFPGLPLGTKHLKKQVPTLPLFLPSGPKRHGAPPRNKDTLRSFRYQKGEASKLDALNLEQCDNATAGTRVNFLETRQVLGTFSEDEVRKVCADLDKSQAQTACAQSFEPGGKGGSVGQEGLCSLGISGFGCWLAGLLACNTPALPRVVFHLGVFFEGAVVDGF